MTAYDEPTQRERFGALRDVPPEPVRAALSGPEPDTGWVVERLGSEGGFPNGGLWRVTVDRVREGGRSAVVVKRTGPHHLGTFPVWRCRSAADDPQWWGREAAFYESDLATSGWPDGVRPTRCYAIDDHDDCRDLWLEFVDDIPASLETCTRAAAGLAVWQVATIDRVDSWLGEDWIPVHVGRHGLDNSHTLAHPAWPVAIERGFDPDLRELVRARVTDPAEIRQRLREFPQVLTHHDFHSHNVGTVDGEVVIIDWAYAGWGPIGHDAGHIVLQLDLDPGTSLAQAWGNMRSAYVDGLASAGWSGDPDVVRRSMAVSNGLRLGWTIDHLLNSIEHVPDDALAAFSTKLRFIAELC